MGLSLTIENWVSRFIGQTVARVRCHKLYKPHKITVHDHFAKSCGLLLGCVKRIRGVSLSTAFAEIRLKIYTDSMQKTE